MATDEHKRLATIIKDCHESLRQTSKQLGPGKAWQMHLENVDQLKTYAKAMSTLAGVWEMNAQDDASAAHSRIQWIIDYCTSYFTNKLYKDRRNKEEHVSQVYGLDCDLKARYLPPKLDRIRLLDVGSCFDPFRNVDGFDVIAIDLYPAKETVLRGDFLKLPVMETAEPEMMANRRELKCLPKEYFDCVVFSLLLEYMPDSEQRIASVAKAYELLRYEGILIIITPDSQHVGKNAKLMKNWRFTLAKMGFSRIKFEKLTHITCLVFRKALDNSLTERWADSHRESYMSFCINTPQDFKDSHENKE